MSKINVNKPGYKHTPLGWIPEEWEVDLLDNLTKRGSGHTPDKAYDNYYNGGIKWISLADSYRLDNGIIDETEFEISQEGIKNSSTVLHPAGTVLMSRDAGIGKSAVMAAEMAVSQHFITWTCNGKFENWFLYYWLQYKKEYFERQAVGSTIKTIGLPLFRKLKVVNPPIREQKKMAAILRTLDDVISRTRQLIDQLHQRNNGLMQQLLTGKKRLKGYHKDWEGFHLGDLFTERNEINCNRLPLLSITAERGVIYQNESDKKDTSNEDKSKYRRICVGDIGYNTMRMWQGRSALSTLEGIVSPAYTIVVPNKDQHSQFYALLFKLPLVINKFFRNSQGLVEDTLNCKFKDFSIVKISIPEYKEQIAISKVILEAFDEVKIYEKRLEVLLQQKKGLMQKLLTGKIRVKI